MDTLLELLSIFLNVSEVGSDAYFDDHHKRYNVFELSINLSKYLASEKVPNIVFVDRSARAAWVGVNTYWNKHYSNIPKPRMYFCNPDGFEKKNAKKDFIASFPKLVLEKNKPVVLFDTCSHTGGTLRKIMRVMNKVGFIDIRPITANAPNRTSKITPACIIDEQVIHRGCVPFGGVDLIFKTSKVLCKPDPHVDRELCIKIRQEIKEILLAS